MYESKEERPRETEKKRERKKDKTEREADRERERVTERASVLIFCLTLLFSNSDNFSRHSLTSFF